MMLSNLNFRNDAKFIVFEGCEGSGKTTQLTKLNTLLNSQGIETWVTKEPGGCTDKLAILRDLALNEDTQPHTELLLILADRSHHVRQIKQALTNNIWVLCDRFSWSTFAYQGYGQGFDLTFLKQLDTFVTGGLKPDLTILLDIDPKTGLQRKFTQGQQNKMESRDLAYHNRVRGGYLKLFESTLLSQNTVCRLFYCKNRKSEEYYTSEEIFENIHQTLPF